MPNDLLQRLKQLRDPDVLDRARDAASQEGAATAELVAYLSEVERRGLHLREGYGTLFDYCTGALGLSEGEAFSRIEAARAARRFPLALELLATSAISLTAVRLLARHLTPENHAEVLRSACGKKRAEVDRLVAALCPQPDVPEAVRRLPTSSAQAAALAPDRYRFQVTIGGATLEKLRFAQDLLRHAVPSGDAAEVLDRALDALLAEVARKKFAATDSPRAGKPGAPGSRNVPAEIKRGAWLRDRARCAYVSPGGRRCEARAFLEFHHVHPYALGGEPTLDNIQLRCAAHNRYEAEADFGPRPHDGRRKAS